MKHKILFSLLIAFGLFVYPLYAEDNPVFGQDDTVQIHTVYVDKGVDSATISWKTSSATVGRVEYAGPDGKWQKTPWGSQYSKQNSFTLLNLKPATTYLYRILAEDENGQLGTRPTESFSTLAPKVLKEKNPQPQEGAPSGFRDILSPSPSPTGTEQFNLPSYQLNPQVLGQRLPLAIPYLLTMPTRTPPSPSPTPTPQLTPTPAPTMSAVAAGLNIQNNLFLYILLGVLLVLVSVVVLKQFREEAWEKDGSKNAHAVKTESASKKFEFEVKSS